MPKTDGTERGAKDFELFEAPGAERLIAEHDATILKLARRLARGRALGVEDLVFEGRLGLLRAARSFDPGRGAKFASYAVYWMRQAMLRALDEKSRTVRLPWQSRAKLKRLREAKAAFKSRNGREPADAELAAEAKLSLRMLRNVQGACVETLSLDAENASPFKEGRETRLADRIADSANSPFEELAAKDSKALFAKAFSSLDAREAKIIGLRFGLLSGSGRCGESCESVGARVGLSREGVRKIQERGISKLRAILLPELLGQERLDAVAV